MVSSSFENQLYLSSVQLNKLDVDLKPIGFASGCLADYCGHRLLLTVSHATGDNGNWAIQVKFEKNKGTLNYQLGAMHFLLRGSINSQKLETVDYSYVKLPCDFVSFRQEIQTDGVVKSEVPITIHSIDFNENPKEELEYGFCGMIKPTHEEHFENLIVGGDLKIYTGLRYVRTENDYHVFKLPFPHPGHKYFRGCSGAPILNDAGEVVALVCEGEVADNEIYAISTKAYKTAIDVLVGNI